MGNRSSKIQKHATSSQENGDSQTSAVDSEAVSGTKHHGRVESKNAIANIDDVLYDILDDTPNQTDLLSQYIQHVNLSQYRHNPLQSLVLTLVSLLYETLIDDIILIIVSYVGYTESTLNYFNFNKDVDIIQDSKSKHSKKKEKRYKSDKSNEMLLSIFQKCSLLFNESPFVIPMPNIDLNNFISIDYSSTDSFINSLGNNIDYINNNYDIYYKLSSFSMYITLILKNKERIELYESLNDINKSYNTLDLNIKIGNLIKYTDKNNNNNTNNNIDIKFKFKTKQIYDEKKEKHRKEYDLILNRNNVCFDLHNNIKDESKDNQLIYINENNITKSFKIINYLLEINNIDIRMEYGKIYTIFIENNASLTTSIGFPFLNKKFDNNTNDISNIYKNIANFIMPAKIESSEVNVDYDQSYYKPCEAVFYPVIKRKHEDVC